MMMFPNNIVQARQGRHVTARSFPSEYRGREAIFFLFTKPAGHYRGYDTVRQSIVPEVCRTKHAFFANHDQNIDRSSFDSSWAHILFIFIFAANGISGRPLDARLLNSNVPFGVSCVTRCLLSVTVLYCSMTLDNNG